MVVISEGEIGEWDGEEQVSVQAVSNVPAPKLA